MWRACFCLLGFPDVAWRFSVPNELPMNSLRIPYIQLGGVLFVGVGFPGVAWRSSCIEVPMNSISVPYSAAVCSLCEVLVLFVRVSRRW